MDGVIPIGRWSFGLDPLIGLVPGIGDLIGAVISMLIVARAVQAGVPRIAVAGMMTNIAIDTLVGSIPIEGDAFDFAYKSNLKNLRIYEESLIDRRAATTRDWAFFIALFLVARCRACRDHAGFTCVGASSVLRESLPSIHGLALRLLCCGAVQARTVAAVGCWRGDTM
jgi:hypothetical protein